MFHGARVSNQLQLSLMITSSIFVRLVCLYYPSWRQFPNPCLLKSSELGWESLEFYLSPWLPSVHYSDTSLTTAHFVNLINIYTFCNWYYLWWELQTIGNDIVCLGCLFQNMKYRKFQIVLPKLAWNPILCSKGEDELILQKLTFPRFDNNFRSTFVNI